MSEKHGFRKFGLILELAKLEIFRYIPAHPLKASYFWVSSFERKSVENRDQLPNIDSLVCSVWMTVSSRQARKVILGLQALANLSVTFSISLSLLDFFPKCSSRNVPHRWEGRTSSEINLGTDSGLWSHSFFTHFIHSFFIHSFIKHMLLTDHVLNTVLRVGVTMGPQEAHTHKLVQRGKGALREICSEYSGHNLE